MTVANVNVTKVLFKRGNTVQNNNYTGVSGEITIDTQAKTLRIHDGSTVGGNIITATLTGNAGSQQAAIDSLNANVGAYQIYANANAATQTVSINAINANLGAFQTFSNANAAAQSTSINSINDNVGAYQTFANANAASQTTEINSLRANITAANTVITNLQSNAAVQAALLDTLTGNAASQSQVLDTLTTNAATQATTLTTLLSNAVAQQTSLIDLVANAAIQAQAIANASGTYSNTNVAAYLGAFDGNILPSANVTYSLGDATHQWKDLWVSNNTIYIGNTPVRVDGGTLLVNGAPVATTVANLVNGASTFQLFANGQSRSPDTIFAANGVTIIDANGAIQGGMYNSGDADWFNIGAGAGRGFKFYVNTEDPGPLFFANGSVNVPGNLYSTAGVIGDINMYGGTISGTNPSWNYLTLTSQIEGYSYVQLPTDATANVANLRIHNDIGNVELVTGDGFSYNYWYFKNDGNLIIPGNLVASQNAYVTGVVQAGRITTGNLTVTGNITQQSAYYETYANVANSGGNLTCNFVNGGTFYATLTANVTANFTNVALTTGTIVGATIIVDQGATPYQISNVQVNSGSIQTVKWAGGVGQNPGTGSNTDVMSFSLINLGGGAWRVLGAISNYG